ncbi:hypothetical protein [Streptomyces sp. NBC_00091]|uniref:hypothetical protein n=1 Tax=Streptomyces sp. NBC_00091 TaxID=2975648 RepID=UPI00224E8C85|nr:hypothetical protein [Streptomyces sp. NBC_00091]MCX5378201.1 hypothetical protein [Streptomyces sp. NBC_00091]
MRCSLIALRVAGVAVALTAATIVTAPAALANEWDRGGVSADPNPAEPGERVKIRVRGCDGDRGVALSPVFVSEARLSPGRGEGRTLWGEATVRSHADRGWHEIRIKCEGADGLRGSVEIRHRDHHRPDPHRSPVWPVHAGGGAMSAEIAESTRLAAAAKKNHSGDGPGLPHTVIGAVLAAAATLAVAGRAITLRRRRNGG